MSPPSAHTASAASHPLSPVHSGILEENCLEILLIAWVAPGKLHRGGHVSSVIWRNMKSVFIFSFDRMRKRVLCSQRWEWLGIQKTLDPINFLLPFSSASSLPSSLRLPLLLFPSIPYSQSNPTQNPVFCFMYLQL